MNYKAIIFDFFGVISQDVFVCWLSDNNLGDLIPDLINSHFQYSDKGTISPEDLFKHLAVLVDRPVDVVESEIRSYLLVNAEMVEMIRHFRPRYKIALCSNAPKGIVEQFLRKANIESLFDTIVISSTVGQRKPEEDIFLNVINSLGVKPQEAIFIDDNKKNVEAAEKFGMKGILFTNVAQLGSELSVLVKTRPNKMYLGINAYSHDSSACIVDENGEIIAAVEEERFTGIKHGSVFPVNSINYCLKQAGITSEGVDRVAIAWHPIEMFTKRIIKEYIFEYNVPWSVFKSSLKKTWRLLFLKRDIKKYIGRLNKNVAIRYYKHHDAHVASSFYASGFDEATFFTLDGRGEYEVGTWGKVDYKNGIKKLGSLHHPNSLGNLWCAISEYCGFIPGWQKAGTTMAFAAFGTPKYLKEFGQMITFEPKKSSNWLTIDTKYFDNRDGTGHVTPTFEKLIGEKGCVHGENNRIHRDVAATLQFYTEKVILEKLNEIHKQTHQTKLVMAGGVCLNSVVNALVLEKTSFKELFIQPASHDAGLSIGSAYLLWREFGVEKKAKEMHGACYGPEYSDAEILKVLSLYDDKVSYSKIDSICNKVADLLNSGKIVAWFQGRMEFGPRALGARSILASATDSGMVCRLNQIKQRESFRPFAISILETQKNAWLVHGYKSPFMLIVESIKPELKSKVPAAQHVDGTVRTQTVNESDNGSYYKLLKEYHNISGIPLFINTSFNIKGKPIVLTPKDALDAFLEVGIDALAIGTYLVIKK